MWYVVTFIVGVLCGAAALICLACCAVASVAAEEDES